MTKQEMIKAVNEKVEGATNKLVDDVLKAYAEVVFETLGKDKNEKVTLPNIGTFSVKEVPERRGISALGEKKEWVKPAHSEIAFKIIKSVKEI